MEERCPCLFEWVAACAPQLASDARVEALVSDVSLAKGGGVADFTGDVSGGVTCAGLSVCAGKGIRKRCGRLQAGQKSSKCFTDRGAGVSSFLVDSDVASWSSDDCASTESDLDLLPGVTNGFAQSVICDAPLPFGSPLFVPLAVSRDASYCDVCGFIDSVVVSDVDSVWFGYTCVCEVSRSVSEVGPSASDARAESSAPSDAVYVPASVLSTDDFNLSEVSLVWSDFVTSSKQLPTRRLQQAWLALRKSMVEDVDLDCLMHECFVAVEFEFVECSLLDAPVVKEYQQVQMYLCADLAWGDVAESLSVVDLLFVRMDEYSSGISWGKCTLCDRWIDRWHCGSMHHSRCVSERKDRVWVYYPVGFEEDPGQYGNKAVDGAFLVDSFSQMVDESGGWVSYMPEMLRCLYERTGKVFMAACCGGAALVSPSGQGVHFLELLACVPSGLEAVVAVICGNDFYHHGGVRHFDSSWLSAAGVLSREMRQKARAAHVVMGGSASVWQYERFMADELLCLYDSHVETLCSHFESHGVRASSGAEELVGLELADSIGHVSVRSVALVHAAFAQWACSALHLFVGSAELADASRGSGVVEEAVDVGDSPRTAPPLLPLHWVSVWHEGYSCFWYRSVKRGCTSWEVPPLLPSQWEVVWIDEHQSFCYASVCDGVPSWDPPSESPLWLTVDERPRVCHSDVLGQGSFGIVVKGSFVGSGLACAVKTISDADDAAVEELCVMSRLRHPHVLELLGYYTSACEVHIVMELCDGSSLSDYLCLDSESWLPGSVVSSFTLQLIAAVEYLHDVGVVHRDLKPLNIMLHRGAAMVATLKVIDFGMSCAVPAVGWIEGGGGTPVYMSPEQIRGRYLETCDEWACGCVLFELMFRCPLVPMGVENTLSAVQRFLKSECFAGQLTRASRTPYGRAAEGLLGSLLEVDWGCRLVAANALLHEFLCGVEESVGPLVSTCLLSTTGVVADAPVVVASERPWGFVELARGEFECLARQVCVLGNASPDDLRDSFMGDGWWRGLRWVVVAKALFVQNRLWLEDGWAMPFWLMKCLVERALRLHESGEPLATGGEDFVSKLLDVRIVRKLARVEPFSCFECGGSDALNVAPGRKPSERRKYKERYCRKCFTSLCENLGLRERWSIPSVCCESDGRAVQVQVGSWRGREELDQEADLVLDGHDQQVLLMLQGEREEHGAQGYHAEQVDVRGGEEIARPSEVGVRSLSVEREVVGLELAGSTGHISFCSATLEQPTYAQLACSALRLVGAQERQSEGRERVVLLARDEEDRQGDVIQQGAVVESGGRLSLSVSSESSRPWPTSLTPDEWDVFWSPDHNRYWFQHRASATWTWQPPPLVRAGWDVRWSGAHGAYYFVDTLHGVSSWELPAGSPIVFSEDSRPVLDMSQVLGEGGFGVVVQGMWSSASRLCAVKRVDVRSGERARACVREMCLMSRLRHPHVIEAYGCYLVDGDAFMAMEFCEGGSLQAYMMNAQYSVWPGGDVAPPLMRQLLSAVKYLHEEGVVHCDIKPQNIMLMQGHGVDVVLKLIDFGCARECDTKGWLHGGGGTLVYMSPEQLCSEFNGLADTWACGCVLFELLSLTSLVPYDIVDSVEVISEYLWSERLPDQIEVVQEQPHVPAQAVALLEELLQLKGRFRASAADALSHPFLRLEDAAACLPPVVRDYQDVQLCLSGVRSSEPMALVKDCASVVRPVSICSSSGCVLVSDPCDLNGAAVCDLSSKRYREAIAWCRRRLVVGSKMCLQRAVLACCRGALRNRMEARVGVSCRGHHGSGLAGGAREARNFASIQIGLVDEGVFLWVLEGCTGGGGVSSKCHLGDPSGRCVGVLLWSVKRQHVVRLVGGGLGRLLAGSVCVAWDEAPWWRSVVGAPKSGRGRGRGRVGGFRGGDVAVMGAASVVARRRVSVSADAVPVPSGVVTRGMVRRLALAGSQDVAVGCISRGDQGVVSNGHVDLDEGDDGRLAVDTECGVEAKATSSCVSGGVGDADLSVLQEVVGEGCAAAVSADGVDVLGAVSDDAGESGVASLLGWAVDYLSEPCDDVLPVAKRRRRTVVYSADAWRRIGPAKIMQGKCMARVWNKGLGGQCPMAGVNRLDGLCEKHDREEKVGGLKYGRVDGPPPEPQLKCMLAIVVKNDQNEAEMQLRAHAVLERSSKVTLGCGSGSGDAVGGVVSGAVRRGVRQPHWYTRFQMWETAAKLMFEKDGFVLHSLDELLDADYDKCLNTVSFYYKTHLGRESVKGALKKDMGPRSHVDRNNEELTSYNGEPGFHKFHFYHPAVFVQQLRTLGVDRTTCSERQCVLALRATSHYIDARGRMHGGLAPYAGPQCYPQLKDDKLFYANGRSVSSVEASATEESGVNSEQLMRCWRRCDLCGKRRLIARESLSSLDSSAYKVVFASGDGVDWGRWTSREEAKRRYDTNVARESDASGTIDGVDDVVPRSDLPTAVVDAYVGVEQVGSAVVDGCAGTDELARELEAALQEQSDAEVCGSELNGGSDDEGDTADPLHMSADVVWDVTTGCMDVEQEEPVSCDAVVSSGVLSSAVGPADVDYREVHADPPRCSGDRSLLFSCGMLQRRRVFDVELGDGRSPSWVPVACEDEDDFYALLKMEARACDFELGDPVVILRGEVDAGGPAIQYSVAGSCGQYLRYGQVLQTPVPDGDDHDDDADGRGSLCVRVFKCPDALHPGCVDILHRHWVEIPSLSLRFAMCEDGMGVDCTVQSRGRVSRRRGAANVDRLMPNFIYGKLRVAEKRVAELRSEAGRIEARLKELRRPKKRASLVVERAREMVELQRMVKRVRGQRVGSGLRWWAPELDRLRRLAADPALVEKVIVIPVKDISVCVAKYEVQLREAPLRALHASQTILTRMVGFRCLCCNERFPTFHPAYRPPEQLGMELFSRRKDGLAACSVEVATWEDPPPFEVGLEAKVAAWYRGTCLRCQRDMAQQREKMGADGGEVVPRRSFLNSMDPCWNFPEEEFGRLFGSLTIPESMLVALDWMQVNVCTVRKTRQHKFRKNVISFPQEVAKFFSMMGALKTYRCQDRVHSTRPPQAEGSNPTRSRLRWFDAPTAWQERFGQDSEGYMFFPATVMRIEQDGLLWLKYDFDVGEGVEKSEHVRPRVQMPYHPRELKEHLVIMLRKNVGYGKVLEGLEIRWGVVCKVMRALTSFPALGKGPWREGGLEDEPMHKSYDPRLFDCLSEEEAVALYAPGRYLGEVVDHERACVLRASGFEVGEVRACQTGEELHAAGVEVRVLCDDGSDDAVTSDAFRKWLELGELSLGTQLAKWWVDQPAGGESDVFALKRLEDETLADFWVKICVDVREGVQSSTACAVGVTDGGVAWGEVISVSSLLDWCLEHLPHAFGVVDGVGRDEMEDMLRFELRVVADMLSKDDSGAAMTDGLPNLRDVSDESLERAKSIVYGWPGQQGEPTAWRSPCRFACAFPLEFPMGVGDLHEDRSLQVSPQEWVQHLLRYHTGQFVRGTRGHRILWALVNTLLMCEAQGKGFAVQRNVMRRMGGRVVGAELMTRGQLRRMLDDEETVRSIVHQLMSVGKDVRSTPMQWASEHKKLDCAVKHLSWRPPWVCGSDDDGLDQYMGRCERVPDAVGLGRIPAFWFTMNPAYNYLHEIHRLNVNGGDALFSKERSQQQTRYDFTRDAPDVSLYVMNLRTELNLRMVMPYVVPHTKDAPFLPMARFEVGKNGNPHWHGFAVGFGNPVLNRDVRTESDGEASDCGGAPCVVEAQGSYHGGVSLGGDDRVSECEVDSEGDVVMEGGNLLGDLRDSAVETRRRRGPMPKRGSKRALQQKLEAELPERHGDREGVQSQRVMEEKFWEYFKDKVSEWNPCRADDGCLRFSWDEAVGAHDVEATVCPDMVGEAPHRVCLRVMLDAFFLQCDSGEAVDLTPLRRLVSALVEKSNRHDRHGLGAPKMGVDACARGSKSCPVCRYGAPWALHSRVDRVCCLLEKGDREGSWRARFPRNDRLVTSHEAHVVLANLGNVDWRPCLNLWAVVEYITKYATKAADGSKGMKDVLRDAVSEVCKYTREGGVTDFFRKTLQKFYAKSVGDRDYGVFESLQLGLNLPLIIPLMPVISLNTLGGRRFKSDREMAAFSGDAAPVTWESKLDKFDKRLAIVRKTFCKRPARCKEMELRVRDVSVYEFFWKHYLHGQRIHDSNKSWALMVTPSFSADCASVCHDRHDAYARMCVVAFWRNMATVDRYRMISELRVGVAVDKRLWGGTHFEQPLMHGGAGGMSLLDSFLGVTDLVRAFDGGRVEEVRWRESERGAEWFIFKRRRGSWPFGWSMALLEMLIDPVLKKWVPGWIDEQFMRWNPGLWSLVDDVLAGDARRELCNRAVLSAVRKKLIVTSQRRMEMKNKKKGRGEGEEAAAERDGDSSGSELKPGGEGVAGGDIENDDPAKDVRKLWHRDAEPAMDEDGNGHDDDVEGAGPWGELSVEEKLSAAPPAPAASERHAMLAPVACVGGSDGEAENVDWSVGNFPSSHGVEGLVDLWSQWRGGRVGGDAKVLSRDQLDPWQKFAVDIVKSKADDLAALEVKGQKAAHAQYKSLRMYLTGTAGTGKSLTVRSCVNVRRQCARDLGVASDAVEGCCMLAAPTGCASFQMKYGATTIHRAFGVPVGFCGPSSDSVKRSLRFQERVAKLRRASLFVLDEFSMIGRQLLGKLVFRVNEALPSPECRPFFMKDVIMAGDPKQAQPVGDEFQFKVGPYIGKGLNKPSKGKVPVGTPSVEDLVDLCRLFQKEFNDAVILQEVHRIDKGESGKGGSPDMDAYTQEAVEYLEVTAKMADCTWTPRQHQFLAKRNRSRLQMTEEGRRELQRFEDAPILMDGKIKRSSGEDGADQVNLQELHRVSQRTGAPIARLRALHGYVGQEGDMKPEELDAADFRGLPSEFACCVGARVLLTQNEWVEAGLMNGALGYVRGFIWPKGGSPGAVDSSRRMPLSIVVEFDDVDLGVEEASDENGEVVQRPRTFFPGVIIGKDVNGKERSLKYVPIFYSEVHSSADDGVYRKQFPLTLAWALTHWKAQGMTLSKVRIRLSPKTAKMPGIGFVAVTRVKHPRHLVFDEDLPPYDDFQQAQYTAGFRQRCRFQLRLKAMASDTLRRYGFCEADRWLPDEVEVAARLLESIRLAGLGQRRRLGKDHDQDAWLWPDEVPPLEKLMETALIEVVGEDQELRTFAQCVAERLLGPLHRPKVAELLGCLIPPDLDPRWDGKKARGKPSGSVSTGVKVFAGRWGVDVYEEQDLREGKLSKGVLEFFRIVLQKVCDKLKLPLLLGTSNLGLLAVTEECAQTLRLKVQAQKSWHIMSEQMARVDEFVVPVPLEVGKMFRKSILAVLRPDRQERVVRPSVVGASGEVITCSLEQAGHGAIEEVGESSEKLIAAAQKMLEDLGSDGEDEDCEGSFPMSAVLRSDGPARAVQPSVLGASCEVITVCSVHAGHSSNEVVGGSSESLVAMARKMLEELGSDEEGADTAVSCRDDVGTTAVSREPPHFDGKGRSSNVTAEACDVEMREASGDDVAELLAWAARQLEDVDDVVVRSGLSGVALSGAKKIVVVIHDRAAMKERGTNLAVNLEGLVRSASRDGVGDGAMGVELLRDFPRVESPFEEGLATFGLLLNRVLSHAGQTLFDEGSSGFVYEVTTVAKAAFAMLRREASKTDGMDVLKCLACKETCYELLKTLSPTRVRQGTGVSPELSRPVIRYIEPAPVRVCRKLLTWNIAGLSKSQHAPESFTWDDKQALVCMEIRRWDVDVCILQECPSDVVFDGLSDLYELAGVALAEKQGAYVHVYVRQGYDFDRVELDHRVPGVVVRLRCGDTQVAVAGVHLEPFDTGSAVREKQFRKVVDVLPGETIVVAGDFNVRDDEVEVWLGLGSFVEAVYSGRSWDPVKMQYDANFNQRRIQGYSFDRALYRGSVLVQSYLVGKGHFFSEGCRFTLSDHSGVMCLLDVDGIFAAQSSGALREQSERRAALARARDTAMLIEHTYVTERAQIGRQQYLQQVADVDMKLLKQQLAEERKAVRARETRRRELWAVAFGSDSCFARGVDELYGVLPDVLHVPAKVCVDFGEGITSLLLLGESSVETVRSGGLESQRNTSYVTCVAHILLRLGVMVVWLKRHAMSCVGDACTACALWKTRLHFGLRAMPELVKHRGHVGDLYRLSVREHDACAFLVAMLAALSKCELALGRFMPCDGVDYGEVGGATHVDCIFGFLEELRRRCMVCGHCTTQYARQYMLDLHSRDGGGGVRMAGDMYLSWCAPSEVEATCSSKVCQASLRTHVQQRRIAALSNVLILRVARAGVDGSVERFVFDVEEELSLPQYGVMELTAVMYHFGKSMDAGSYTCACRASGGGFGYYDGCKPPVMVHTVGAELRRNVVALVYARPGLSSVLGKELIRHDKGSGSRSERPAVLAKDRLLVVSKDVLLPVDERLQYIRSHLFNASRYFASGPFVRRVFLDVYFGMSEDVESLLMAAEDSLFSRADGREYQDLVSFARFAWDCRRWQFTAEEFEAARRFALDVPGGEAIPADRLGKAFLGKKEKKAEGRASALAAERRMKVSEGLSHLFPGHSQSLMSVLERPSVLTTEPLSVQESSDPVQASIVLERKRDAVTSCDPLFLRAREQSTVASRSDVSNVSLAVMSRPDVESLSLLPVAIVDRSSLSCRSAAMSVVDRGMFDGGRRLLDSRLGLLLTRSGLLPAVVLRVLCELERRFGRCRVDSLVNAAWFVDWEPWRDLVGDVCGWDDDSSVIEGLVKELVSNALRLVDRHAVQDEEVRVGFGGVSDVEHLAVLRGMGWELLRSSPAGNNCFADSLLILLMRSMVVRDTVNRGEACRRNRAYLEDDDALVPRNEAGRPTPGALLQHHRHAAATVGFFVAEYGDLERLPLRGVNVVVHARYDNMAEPDSICVCSGLSDTPGDPLEFSLFNWTGHEFSGLHYDALIRLVADVIVVDEVRARGVDHSLRTQTIQGGADSAGALSSSLMTSCAAPPPNLPLCGDELTVESGVSSDALGVYALDGLTEEDFSVAAAVQSSFDIASGLQVGSSSCDGEYGVRRARVCRRGGALTDVPDGLLPAVLASVETPRRELRRHSALVDIPDDLVQQLGALQLGDTKRVPRAPRLRVEKLDVPRGDDVSAQSLALPSKKRLGLGSDAMASRSRAKELSVLRDRDATGFALRVALPAVGEPSAVVQDCGVWQRFTPSIIDPSKCQARTWRGGLGGQCSKVPRKMSECCQRCGADPVHGRVTGPIPHVKLSDFLKHEARRSGRVEPRLGSLVD